MSEIKDNLVALLDEFLINTKVSNSSLITEDGLVIVSNSNQNEQDEEINCNFAAISASILSMAERGIEIINENKLLEQITIDAGMDYNLEKDFTILITRVFSNVLLQIIFPKRINIGLIHFETNKIIKKIKNIIENDVSRELFTSIGSLT
ncbi:MAG: roadblock/LC7 domain-containing protein [Candidatus Thorarchaeota archaeon]